MNRIVRKGGRENKGNGLGLVVVSLYQYGMSFKFTTDTEHQFGKLSLDIGIR